MKLAYSGKNYHGFQIQKNALTVQEVVQKALQSLLKHDIMLKGCSRTDSGAHANEYVISFNTTNKIPCRRLVYGLNALLPNDIAAKECDEVAGNFHARYSATRKEYIYKILNTSVKNPFLDGLVYWYPSKLEVTKLNNLAKCFVGQKDYRAFCSMKSNQKDFVRTIYNFEVFRLDDIIYFRVVGDGFLYNMVRIMVGTLLSYHQRGLTHEDLKRLIESGSRSAAGKTAPSSGLYLNRVFYD